MNYPYQVDREGNGICPTCGLIAPWFMFQPTFMPFWSCPSCGFGRYPLHEKDVKPAAEEKPNVEP